MSMNYNWVIEHKNGQITAKRDQDKKLNAYHTRQEHVKRDNVKTFALQDEQGNPKVIVDVPDGAQIFQRHRVVGVNYYNRFHEVTESTPEHFDSTSHKFIPAKTTKRTIPEYTYDDVWLIGYRTATEVYFKAVYKDGKIDEHHGWNEKPWLYEPEWFPEEQV